MSKENNLKLIIMPNITTFGNLVGKKLKTIRNENTSNIVNVKLDRFSNGEGKATLVDSVRGKDIFLLSDVGNYGPESVYTVRNQSYLRSPDDHFHMSLCHFYISLDKIKEKVVSHSIVRMLYVN